MNIVKKPSKVSLYLMTSLVLIMSTSLSQAKQKGERRGPPQEALAACESLSAGDQCAFEGRRGNVSGLCVSRSEDKPLACKPEGHKDRGSRDNENQRDTLG